MVSFNGAAAEQRRRQVQGSCEDAPAAASMEPPLNSGGDWSGELRPSPVTDRFNGAAAEQRRRRGRPRAAYWSAWASMEPPLNSGGDLPTEQREQLRTVASMEPPLNSGGDPSSGSRSSSPKRCFNGAAAEQRRRRRRICVLRSCRLRGWRASGAKENCRKAGLTETRIADVSPTARDRTGVCCASTQSVDTRAAPLARNRSSYSVVRDHAPKITLAAGATR